MQTKLVKDVSALRAKIKNQVGKYHLRLSEAFPTVDVSKRICFTPHMSGTEGVSLMSHAKFHARDKKKAKGGGWLGRGWAGLAYTMGAGVKYGIIQAWNVNTVTYHCGPGNYVAIGGMLEGNFAKRAPTDYELLMMLAMKIDADNQCQFRLEIKYHDQWKKGWICPGQFWPKIEFARMEQQYYIDLTIKEEEEEDEPEIKIPSKPEPKAKEPDTEDPASYPRGKEPRGCVAALGSILSLIKLQR